MPRKRNSSDTTQILALVTLAKNTRDAARRDEYLADATKMLVDIDARTTSRDPRLRKRRKRKTTKQESE